MIKDSNRFKLDAVIFDLDGTLINTIDIYFKMIHVALDRLHMPPVSRRDLAEAVREGDFDWDCILPKDLNGRKDEVIRKAWKIIYEMDSEIFQVDLKMIPGATEIVKEIAASGMKIGVVTSTPKRKIEEKLYPLVNAGIDGLLKEVITTDDVARKKPAADPLIECGKRLGIEMGRSAYVGDSRVDIQAGKAAGMKTIGVLTGLDDYETLKHEGPDVIMDSVVQLRDTIHIQQA